MANHGRSNVLDALKVMMALLVISIHTITPGTEFKYLLTQGVARIAVPFFFIAAGYYLSAKQDNTSFHKTLSRLSLLYLAWCIFYSPFIAHDVYTNSGSFGVAITNTLYILIKGWRHLWYMPAMIMGIAVYYFLRKTKCLYYVAIVLYISGVILQNEVPQSEYSIIYYRNFAIFGFPLIALGGFLRKFASYKLNISLLAISVISSFALLISESKIKYVYGLYNNDMLILSPVVASAMFLLASNVRIKLSINTAGIAGSIYFVHYLFYLMLKDAIPNEYCLFISVSIASILFSYSMARFNFYKKYFI